MWEGRQNRRHGFRQVREGAVERISETAGREGGSEGLLAQCESRNQGESGGAQSHGWAK